MAFLDHSHSSLQRAHPGDIGPERRNVIVLDKPINRRQQLVDALRAMNFEMNTRWGISLVYSGSIVSTSTALLITT